MRKEILSLFARLVLMLSAVCLVVSCGDDPLPPQEYVSLTEGSSASLVFPADKTGWENQIIFNSTGKWTAAVVSAASNSSYSEPVYWLLLSDYGGDAGDNTIGMSLAENATGKDRKAEIHITCGQSKVTLTVVQKAEKKGAGELLQ